MIVKTQEISFNVEMESLKLSDGITLGDQVHYSRVCVHSSFKQLFQQIFCELGSEMSEGMKTGVSITPDTLHLQENGRDEANITITLHTPLQCPTSSSCSLDIALTVQNDCKISLTSLLSL